MLWLGQQNQIKNLATLLTSVFIESCLLTVDIEPSTATRLRMRMNWSWWTATLFSWWRNVTMVGTWGRQNAPRSLVPSQETMCSLYGKEFLEISQSGPRLNKKTVFPGIGIPMLKIRRSWDCLIFNMGIPILISWYLYVEMQPPGTFLMRPKK